MSTAFVPSNTRKNHPDWVADPVVDYTRSTARKYHRRGLKHAKARGSGTIDRRTPESFSWKRRPGATTTVEINHKRSETRIQHENAKISRKINQLMGVRIRPRRLCPGLCRHSCAAVRTQSTNSALTGLTVRRPLPLPRTAPPPTPPWR